MAGLSPSGSADGRHHSITSGDSQAFGEFLRHAREHRGLTLEQISRETKIPSRHLDALEHGQLAAVPGGVYRRAEVRAYAQVVGLDQRVALEHLEDALAIRERRDHPVAATPLRRAPPARAITALALAIAIAASVGYAVWHRASADHDLPAAAVAAQPIDRSETPSSPPVAAPTSSSHAGDAAPERVDVLGRSAAAADVAIEPDMPTAADEGTLVVTTDPAGARVTVNGIGRGATPLTMSFLPLGELRLRISREGYQSEERVVRVEARRSKVSLHVTMRAATVTARPQ